MSSTRFIGAETESGVIVRCWVVPGASRSEIKGVHGDALRLRVRVPPERGKANAEACRLLTQVIGHPAEVVSGTTSRAKSILVRGASRADIVEALDPFLPQET